MSAEISKLVDKFTTRARRICILCKCGWHKFKPANPSLTSFCTQNLVSPPPRFTRHTTDRGEKDTNKDKQRLKESNDDKKKNKWSTSSSEGRERPQTLCSSSSALFFYVSPQLNSFSKQQQGQLSRTKAKNILLHLVQNRGGEGGRRRRHGYSTGRRRNHHRAKERRRPKCDYHKLPWQNGLGLWLVSHHSLLWC